MKQRPVSIWIISLVYMLIAPMGLGFLYYKSGFNIPFFLDTLSFDLLAVLFAGSVVGIGVFMVRPWGYFAFLGYSAALVLGMSFKHFLNPTTFSYVTVVALVGGIGAIAAFIQKHFSAPYFNPQMRWWETDPRYEAYLNVTLKVDGKDYKASLQDISKSGCFLSSEVAVVPGDVVQISIDVLDYDFKTHARVVRKSRANEGYGVMFLDMTTDRRKMISSILRYLKQSRRPVQETAASA